MQKVENEIKTPRSRDELVVIYKQLSRALADETMSEVEAAPLRNQREEVLDEIVELS